MGACVLAGALIGGITAASEGDDGVDGVLMGATIGSAVGGLTAPFTAVGTTASTVATTAAKSAQQLAEKAAREGATDAAKQAAKEAAQQAVQAAEKLVEETAKQAGKNAATKAGDEAANRALATAKEGLDKVTNEAFDAGSKSFASMAKFGEGAATALMDSTRSAYYVGTALINTSGSMTKGSANAVSADKASDAQVMDVWSKRIRALMDKFQEQIQKKATYFI